MELYYKFVYFGRDPNVGFCEHKLAFVFSKSCEFLHPLHNNKFRMDDPASWTCSKCSFDALLPDNDQ